MTIRQIKALTTSTAAATGANVDVSDILGDWTLKLQVADMHVTSGTDTPKARFQFTDCIGAGTSALTGPTFSCVGQIVNTSDIVQSWKRANFPDLRCGTTSANLHFDVSALTANTSVSYSAWIEF